MQQGAKLKDQVVSGFIWTAGQKVGSLTIAICSRLVLLTMLRPADFGLMAMLAIFTAVADSLVDSGFSQALIQKKEVKAIDYDSTFWLNIGIAALLFAALQALCSPIARFNGEEQLLRIAPLVFLTLPIHALSLVQSSILQRNMNFRSISRANLLATLASAVVALSMALFEMGVMALVGQTLTLYAVRSALIWSYSSWRPKLRFSWGAIRGIYSFGSRLFITGVITQLFNKLSYTIIGRHYGADRLGLYAESLKLKEETASTISISVTNVAFPAFSSIQDDTAKLLTASRKTIAILSFALFPVMLGLIAAAPEGFLIAGQEKWLPAVPYFRIFCLAGLFIPLSQISLNIIKAKGHGNTLMWSELLKKGVGFAAIIWAANISVTALAWAYFGWTAFEMLVNLTMASRITAYSFRQQMSDTLPYILISGAMLACVWLAGTLFGGTSVIELLGVKLGVGIVSYVALSMIFRPAAWRESIATAKTLFGKTSSGITE